MCKEGERVRKRERGGERRWSKRDRRKRKRRRRSNMKVKANGRNGKVKRCIQEKGEE